MEITKLFKLEDVWTTGLVMKNVPNLTRIHMPMFLHGPNVAVLHPVKASLIKDSTANVIKMGM